MTTIRGTKGDDYLRGVASTTPGFENHLFGEAGDDSIRGALETRNYLHGGSGDDIILAGTLYDRLYGNSGDDHLFAGTSDNARLYGGSGTDVLDAGDTLFGAYLDGGSGADRMIGGLGADTFIVDNVRDSVGSSVTPGEAIREDTVFSSVSFSFGGNLTLTGTADIDGTASGWVSGGSTLTGNDGRNHLKGGDRADTITGGKGADVFVYDDASLSMGHANPHHYADHITDFSRADGDRIDLSGLTFSEALPDGEIRTVPATFIGSHAFSGAIGEVRAVAHSDHTNIFFDSDGDKVADAEIVLLGNHHLAAQDFII